MKAVPTAFPNCSFTDYDRLVSAIVKVVRENAALCELTSHPDLAQVCFADAVRILRNVAVFVQDQHEASSTESQEKEIVRALASIAAGSTFCGVGDRATKLRQYKRWLAGLTDKTPLDRHPLVHQVFEIINEFSSSASRQSPL